MGFPEIFADVETNGFFHFSINLKQKGSFDNRIPRDLSADMIFGATFLGLSKIRVVGFSDKSIICQATLGYLKNIVHHFSPFIKTIMLWVSALVSVCRSWPPPQHLWHASQFPKRYL
jgi:hypothetical protein